MKKNVTVISTDNNKIVVGCDSSHCSGCKSEMFCRNKDSSFDVINPKGIKIEKGDIVEINIPEGKATLSVLISLLFPLLLFLPGYFIGKLFLNNEIQMALFGFLFMAIGFLIAAAFFHFKKRTFTPTIEKKEEK